MKKGKTVVVEEEEEEDEEIDDNALLESAKNLQLQNVEQNVQNVKTRNSNPDSVIANAMDALLRRLDAAALKLVSCELAGSEERKITNSIENLANAIAALKKIEGVNVGP